MGEPTVRAYRAADLEDLYDICVRTADAGGDARGRGFGRRLMDRFLAGLRDAGVRGVHLSMLATNTGARAFYDRLGFALLRAEPALFFLGRDTSPLPSRLD